MNLRAAVVLLLVAAVLNAQELPVYWSKSAVGRPINVEQRAIFLTVVGYGSDGYYAYCGLSNQGSKLARVSGTRDKSKDFRARATLSVSSAEDGPWRKVVEVAPAGKRTMLLVKPHSDSETILVDLNKLAPLIDKAEYAKISLPTGEATIFSIKELKH